MNTNKQAKLEPKKSNQKLKPIIKKKSDEELKKELN